MELTEEKSISRYRLAIMTGIILWIFSLATMWLGINSILIGLAYYEQRGFWVPCLAGATLAFVGCWLLLKGTATISENQGMKKRGEVV